MPRFSHGNSVISLFCALLMVVCIVCESQTNDPGKRPTCNLYVPAHAKATIIKPNESPGSELKNNTENDFVREKEINSLTSGDIYPTYVALFECELGYTLIGNTRLSCVQEVNGNTAKLDGSEPTCEINECFWFGKTQNDHVEFRFKEQLLSSWSSSFPNGTELIFSDSACPLGQSLNKSSPKITCHQGKWTRLSPSCIAESSSCSWAGSKKNVLFVFNTTVLNNKSEHYAEGTMAIELNQKETCPPGLVSRQYSVKLCEKRKWNIVEHPCVAPTYSSDARMDRTSSDGLILALLWANMLFLIIILCLAFLLMYRLQLKRLIRIRGSTQDGNRLHAEDAAEQLTGTDAGTQDPYSFIPEVRVSRTEDPDLVAGDAQPMAIYSELNANNELVNGGGQATYAFVLPKAKRG